MYVCCIHDCGVVKCEGFHFYWLVLTITLLCDKTYIMMIQIDIVKWGGKGGVENYYYGDTPITEFGKNHNYSLTTLSTRSI